VAVLLASMNLIDTHCHVHFNAYKEDMDAVIKKTLEKGVAMITIGTQKDTSRRGLEVAEQYEGLWATVGIHPNHLCEQTFVDDQELEPEQRQIIKTRCEVYDHAYYLNLAQHPKCVAIGECGLDFFHVPEHLDREEVIKMQEDVCRRHFELASEVGLPVVLHTRDAHARQLVLIDEYLAKNKLQRRGVTHCFTGTLEEAQEYVKRGFLVSFTGIATFKARASDRDEEGFSTVQRVIKALPLEYMMIETDAPYLAPGEYRGKRCEPWMVKEVAKKIAELKRIPLEEVMEVTSANAKRLFAIEF
jgi:TatD DNase family protein